MTVCVIKGDRYSYYDSMAEVVELLGPETYDAWAGHRRDFKVFDSYVIVLD